MHVSGKAISRRPLRGTVGNVAAAGPLSERRALLGGCAIAGGMWLDAGPRAR